MKKVLIIEDNPVVTRIYSGKLSDEGYEVLVAGDGEAGLAEATTARPDAVILDLLLPKLPGLEVLRRLRAQPDLAATPVIVFSNTAEGHMARDAWSAGATDVLAKTSVSPVMVVAAVRNALAVAEKRRKAEALAAAVAAAAPQATEAAPPWVRQAVHTLSNHLSVVLGLSQLLLEEPDQPPQRLTDLKELYEAAQKSMDVTRALQSGP